jgi:hypothetical protein
MGHIRLGKLPATKQWHQVVALLSRDASVEQIAGASAKAADSSLAHARNDPAVQQSFWLLTQIPLAARAPDFAKGLQNLGLDVGASPSLFDVVGAFAKAVDNHSENPRVGVRFPPLGTSFFKYLSDLRMSEENGKATTYTHWFPFSVGIRPWRDSRSRFCLDAGPVLGGGCRNFFGTAITVAALATLAMGSRELALRLGGTNSNWTTMVWSICAIGGATVILLFGVLMFMASLGPARPSSVR